MRCGRCAHMFLKAHLILFYFNCRVSSLRATMIDASMQPQPPRSTSQLDKSTDKLTGLLVQALLPHMYSADFRGPRADNGLVAPRFFGRQVWRGNHDYHHAQRTVSAGTILSSSLGCLPGISSLRSVLACTTSLDLSALHCAGRRWRSGRGRDGEGLGWPAARSGRARVVRVL